MAQITEKKPTHPDFHVMHSIPGRIRLRTPKLRGRPEHAQEIVRRLSALKGIHTADANPVTGSITVHYHPSALDSVEFFAEIAAALGLIATGLDPSEVAALFEVFGASPEEIGESYGQGIGQDIAIPMALFAMGFLAGRRFG
ncbi:MAG: heavy-metal-associated domain-containing protein [Planctomycetaceae bacterium]|nr:heavy-metal-associated domain-containing protein [Planctomycetaceae bacterium]